MTCAARCRVAVAALLLTMPCAVSAAPDKPDISIKTRAAEITVVVADALKRQPGLGADCLTEGRRWAEKNRAEADKALREDPADFSGGRKWSLEREYTSRSVVARYVSVVRSDYSYTGGAHPNTNVDTILWDREAKKRISIRPFLKESADNGATMTAMAKLVRVAVAREKIARGLGDAGDAAKTTVTPEAYLAQDSFIADGVQPTLLKLGPVTLAPSPDGVFFYLPQCDGQDQAKLATFGVAVTRGFECSIDGVADPAGLFATLELGQPVSKMVRR
jgi:Deacetylase PdaC